MVISEDTTTQIIDDTEDKMQILSGSERLKYFTGEIPIVTEPLSRKKSGLISFILNIFK